MKQAQIVTVVGARPQFVKAAPLSRAIRADGRLAESIVHTGQHYDENMSDVFFQELNIPTPKHRLNLGGGGHGKMTGRMIEAVEEILVDEAPEAVVVYGDTNTTLAAAIAAAKLHIPIVHIEAGLRSFNRRMPEEINRILTDHASSLLLCPTSLAMQNLKMEGLSAKAHLVGDIMFDATLHAIETGMRTSDIVDRLGLSPGYAVATLHRSENTDDSSRLRRCVEYISKQADTRKVVLPLHPRTRQRLLDADISLSGIQLTEPLGYVDLHRLLVDADLIITDSGGLQKEAYFHRKPCITLRDETEWIETIECGWNRLWHQNDWQVPRVEISDYGMGDTAQRCVEKIADFLGNGPTEL
ncbi:MAG: UDP-N-acetylglucosamine 2-epimerase (non-hydrolyzing) [Acidobacteria bacterium]|nr:UDP-N-acetylglucosamine 2-epimerase (non-hydrolyzing) [Acidobacteriota bacterium]